MAGRLEGKVAIVSGAGCIGPGWGNGRAAAVAFAREDARVFAVDLKADAMTETVERATQAASGSGEIRTHTCDVTVSDQVQAMVQACVTAFGRVDIMVNNIGGSTKGGVVELSEEACDRQMDFNLKSVFLGCKHVIPVMEAAGGGAIVNMSSASALRWTGAAQVGYASSKAAVIQFGRVIPTCEDIDILPSVMARLVRATYRGTTCADGGGSDNKPGHDEGERGSVSTQTGII